MSFDSRRISDGEREYYSDIDRNYVNVNEFIHALEIYTGCQIDQMDDEIDSRYRKLRFRNGITAYISRMSDLSICNVNFFDYTGCRIQFHKPQLQKLNLYDPLNLYVSPATVSVVQKNQNKSDSSQENKQKTKEKEEHEKNISKVYDEYLKRINRQ